MLDKLKALIVAVLTVGGGTSLAKARKAIVAGLSAGVSAIASTWVATGAFPTSTGLWGALGLALTAAAVVWSAPNSAPPVAQQ